LRIDFACEKVGAYLDKNIMQISADDFAEKMKTVGASFRVTGIVYPKEGGKFIGEGTIIPKIAFVCI
jgi:hypothetical protein